MVHASTFGNRGTILTLIGCVASWKKPPNVMRRAYRVLRRAPGTHAKPAATAGRCSVMQLDLLILSPAKESTMRCGRQNCGQMLICQDVRWITNSFGAETLALS